MSLQTDVVSWFQNNTAITAVIPFASFWLGLAPEGSAFPYAVMTIVASTPTYVTNGPRDGYIEDFQFQISVYNTDPDACLSAALTIAAQLEGQSISSACMAVWRLTGPVMVVDSDTPELVYHAYSTFNYQARISG
jgi:hypothetical protein